MQPRRIKPRPGQESVWDYPRPPRIEASSKPVKVTFAGVVVASSGRAARVLETASPPTYYIPPDDVVWEHLRSASGRSMCHWKGRASYYDIVVGDAISRKAAWSYPKPKTAFEAVEGFVAFYARRATCFVGNEAVTPQPGDFYGGWVTSDIVGPFKGEAATLGW